MCVYACVCVCVSVPKLAAASMPAQRREVGGSGKGIGVVCGGVVHVGVEVCVMSRRARVM